MKKYFVKVLFIFISFGIFSQQEIISENEYNNRKLNGTLTGNEILSINTNSVNPNFVNEIMHQKSQGCGGYFDPPGAAQPIVTTDDGFFGPIPLQFNFCFFGQTFNSVYMNNNGNISFGNGITAFSSSAFPSTGNQMIAAFWADFDFGSCGTMHYTTTPTAAIFNWVNAGYFMDQCDKKNTCQIVITNGNDPLVPGGNVAIYYKNMDWTTGSASNGTNGFGGTPATAGANKGDNLNFFQIGQFDHTGNNYDGPNGNADGVDYLDNKSFVFDFCTTDGNIAPIPTEHDVCDTIKICTGNTQEIKFPFIAPENNQTTTVTYSAPTLNNVTVVSITSAYEGEITLKINGSDQALGMHNITLTGTDNATIPKSTSITYMIEIIDLDSIIPIKPLITYPVTCLPLTLTVNNATYDGYLWGTGETSNTSQYSNINDTASVIVFNKGCYYIADSLNLKYIPILDVNINDDTICNGYQNSINASVNFIQNVDSYLWNTNATTPSIIVSEGGLYTCTVTNQCGSDMDSAVIIGKKCDINMPNTFSPNGDGNNDYFELIADDLEFFTNFKITIVNRWGNIVAEFDNPKFKWDGKDLKGNLLQSGVYFYNLTSTTIENSEINRQGFVQLFGDK